MLTSRIRQGLLINLVIIGFISPNITYAAVEIELVNERTVKGKKHTFTVTGLFEGQKARYTFHTDENSEIVSGTYLLSLDGGESTYFITENDDEEIDKKICHQWSSQEFTRILGKYLLKVTGKFNVEVSEPVVIRVFEKTSENIHGLPVKHLRLHANFVSSYKYMLFNDTLKVERQIDTWLTPKIKGVTTKPVLQMNWQATGYLQADKVLIDAAKLLTGYPLRSEIIQTITNKKGKQTITQIKEHMKSIREIGKPAADAFDVPECTTIGSYEMEQYVKHLLLVVAGKPL